MLNIRRATQKDADTIWSIIRPVIRAGDTYALESKMKKQQALSYWMSADKWTFVAEESDEIFGTYYMKTNQAGGGSHVCNCGYITSESARGRGIARQMCEHSLIKAPELGFKAMQYNCVYPQMKALFAYGRASALILSAQFQKFSITQLKGM